MIRPEIGVQGEGLLRIASHIFVAALLAAAPFTATGKPIGAFRFVVTDAGDQTDPSIDGEYVVYAGPGPGDAGTDVLLYDATHGAVRVVAGGSGEQHAPDLWRSTAIFLDPLGVTIRELGEPGWTVRGPGDVAAGAPAIGEEVAAWEIGPSGGRDIRVCRYRSGEEYTMAAPDGSAPVGDQLAPAAWGALVGYVDGRTLDAAW